MIILSIDPVTVRHYNPAIRQPPRVVPVLGAVGRLALEDTMRYGLTPASVPLLQRAR